MVEKTVEDDIRETLSSLKEPVAEPADENESEELVEEPAAEENPNEEAPEGEPPVEEPKKPEVDEEDAPLSLSGAIKAKWKDLPADVRAEWKKREDDIQAMVTRHDGDLAVGRKIKEIAAPYEAVIRSEGGTVEGAFKDLLNTSYILRAGTPMQKAQAVHQAIQQFGVDLSLLGNPQQQNPISAIQQEMQQLRQQADPARIKSELQEQMEADRINGEIQAFAANPANVHFEAVKSTMGSLIGSGRAKDLQTAYDMAIWSDPSIRTELLNAQKTQEAEKKKTEMAAKKKASASVIGSPGMTSPNANASQKSLEDEIRDSLRSSSGKI